MNPSAAISPDGIKAPESDIAYPIASEGRLRLEGETRKRARQLKSGLIVIAQKETSNSEAVHQVRKASRRLQSTIDLLMPEKPANVRRFIKRLKACRRALGDWRDGDVLTAQVKAEKQKSRSADEKDAWATVAKRIAKSRDRAIYEFSRTSCSRQAGWLARKAKKLILPAIDPHDLNQKAHLAIQRAWIKWHDALDQFSADPDRAHLHAVRIKTKTLRYTLEVAEKSCPGLELDHLPRWLEDIQEKVGAWHDQLLLGGVASKALSKGGKSDARSRLIRTLRDRESRMAVSAAALIRSLKRTPQYRQLDELEAITPAAS